MNVNTPKYIILYSTACTVGVRIRQFLTNNLNINFLGYYFFFFCFFLKRYTDIIILFHIIIQCAHEIKKQQSTESELTAIQSPRTNLPNLIYLLCATHS